MFSFVKNNFWHVLEIFKIFLVILLPDPSTLESSLQSKLDLIYCQEKDIWALKSCMDWLMWNDLNVSFLKASSLHSRRTNRILALKDGVSNWSYDSIAIKSAFQAHFSDLFSTQQICSSLD